MSNRGVKRSIVAAPGKGDEPQLKKPKTEIAATSSVSRLQVSKPKLPSSAPVAASMAQVLLSLSRPVAPAPASSQSLAQQIPIAAQVQFEAKAPPIARAPAAVAPQAKAKSSKKEKPKAKPKEPIFEIFDPTKDSSRKTEQRQLFDIRKNLIKQFISTLNNTLYGNASNNFFGIKKFIGQELSKITASIPQESELKHIVDYFKVIIQALIKMFPSYDDPKNYYPLKYGLENDPELTQVSDSGSNDLSFFVGEKSGFNFRAYTYEEFRAARLPGARAANTSKDDALRNSSDESKRLESPPGRKSSPAAALALLQDHSHVAPAASHSHVVPQSRPAPRPQAMPISRTDAKREAVPQPQLIPNPHLVPHAGAALPRFDQDVLPALASLAPDPETLPDAEPLPAPTPLPNLSIPRGARPGLAAAVPFRSSRPPATVSVAQAQIGLAPLNLNSLALLGSVTDPFLLHHLAMQQLQIAQNLVQQQQVFNLGIQLGAALSSTRLSPG